ncbi:MAG: transposase [Ferruginibacter sp.]|nr:transposase [Ferruginibacter sp.]
MSDTYTQLYIQLVFAVKRRNNFIQVAWEKLYKYITAVVQNDRSQKVFWSWQAGYGAFSYGRSQIDMVCKYIANQKQHHLKRSFKTEYISLLSLFGIAFKNEYLFQFYD